MIKAYDTNPILIDIPMPIRTNRILIRPHQEGDGKLLAEGVCETWDDLKLWFNHFMGSRDEETDARYKEIYARNCMVAFAKHENLKFILCDISTNKFLGTAGLINPNWRVRRFEIDYWITKSAQGKGYATEATHALLIYAFEVLAARIVTIGHAEGNEASKKIINKLGFTHAVRKLFDYELPDGELVDGHGYYRLNIQNLPELKVSWG